MGCGLKDRGNVDLFLRSLIMKGKRMRNYFFSVLWDGIRCYLYYFLKFSYSVSIFLCWKEKI